MHISLLLSFIEKGQVEPVILNVCSPLRRDFLVLFSLVLFDQLLEFFSLHQLIILLFQKVFIEIKLHDINLIFEYLLGFSFFLFLDGVNGYWLIYWNLSWIAYNYLRSSVTPQSLIWIKLWQWALVALYHLRYSCSSHYLGLLGVRRWEIDVWCWCCMWCCDDVQHLALLHWRQILGDSSLSLIVYSVRHCLPLFLVLHSWGIGSLQRI